MKKTQYNKGRLLTTLVSLPTWKFSHKLPPFSQVRAAKPPQLAHTHNLSADEKKLILRDSRKIKIQNNLQKQFWATLMMMMMIRRSSSRSEKPHSNHTAHTGWFCFCARTHGLDSKRVTYILFTFLYWFNIFIFHFCANTTAPVLPNDNTCTYITQEHSYYMQIWYLGEWIMKRYMYQGVWRLYCRDLSQAKRATRKKTEWNRKPRRDY